MDASASMREWKAQGWWQRRIRRMNWLTISDHEANAIRMRFGDIARMSDDLRYSSSWTSVRVEFRTTVCPIVSSVPTFAEMEPEATQACQKTPNSEQPIPRKAPRLSRRGEASDKGAAVYAKA